MENTRDVQPVPDWYPDPHGRHELRYWDGAAWTADVADQGTASVDAVDSLGPEVVLLTLSRVTDPSWGGFATAYLTDRRLVVEQVLGAGATMGAVAAGGLVGLTLARNAAETNAAREADGRVRTIDEVLAASGQAYAIAYSDISEMTLTRRALPLGYSRCRIRSSRKDVTLAFKREMFDDVSALLIGALPGRVTVK